MRKTFLGFFAFALICGSASAETPFAGMVDIGDFFTNGGALSTLNLDATNDAVEMHYVARKTFAYDQICIRVGTNAGDPPAYKVGVQGLAASGDPIRSDGTYKTGGGECSASYDPPSGTGHNNTEQCFTVTGTTCSVTAGEMYSIVVVPTGTPDGSNYLSVAYSHNAMFNDTTFHRNNADESVTVNAGTASQTQLAPISFLKDTGSSTYLGNTFKAYIQSNFSDSTNPDEFCNRILYDLPSGCSYTIDGARIFWGSTPAAGGTWELRLYDATPTMLDSTPVDSDHTTSHGAGRTIKQYLDDGDSLADATEYFLCVKSTSTSSGQIVESEVESNAEFDAWPGGTAIYKATRNNGAGTFSATTTRRMGIWPILGSITCSGGSGGESGSRINARIN